MWIKVLLAVLIVAFCSLLGYLAAAKYRARRKFYAQMASFNDKYLNELTYRRRPLGELIGEQLERGGDFYTLLEDRKTEIKLQYLTEQERRECEEYLKMLGTGDSNSQKDYFSAKKQTLESKKGESEKAAKERGGLYLKLGLLSGLAFVILII